MQILKIKDSGSLKVINEGWQTLSCKNYLFTNSNQIDMGKQEGTNNDVNELNKEIITSNGEEKYDYINLEITTKFYTRLHKIDRDRD